MICDEQLVWDCCFFVGGGKEFSQNGLQLTFLPKVSPKKFAWVAINCCASIFPWASIRWVLGGMCFEVAWPSLLNIVGSRKVSTFLNTSLSLVFFKSPKKKQKGWRTRSKSSVTLVRRTTIANVYQSSRVDDQTLPSIKITTTPQYRWLTNLTSVIHPAN